MNALVKPDCLHVPTLYEGEEAFFYWDEVEGAEGYELDIIYDEDFETAEPGIPWKEIDESGLTWDELEARDLTWEQLEALMASFAAWRGEGEPYTMPGVGLSWEEIERLSGPWQAMDERNLTWQEFERLLECGMVWEDLDRLAGTWQQMDDRQLTWYEFERLEQLGRSWEHLDARYRTWDELEAEDKTWREWERMKLDRTPHRSCEVVLETGASFACVRVRAVCGGEKSPYIISTRLPILPMAQVELTTRAGHAVRVLSEGIGVRSFTDTAFTLLYNEEHLRFDGTQLQVAGQTIPLPRGLNILDHKPGAIRFICDRQVPEEKVAHGLLALFCFTAQKTGATTLWLRRNKR